MKALKEKKFSKILVCIDGSQSSKQALENAINIARKYNSELIAIHVVFSHIPSAYSHSGVFSGLTIPDYVKKILESYKQEALKWLDIIEPKNSKNDIRYQTDVLYPLCLQRLRYQITRKKRMSTLL